MAAVRNGPARDQGIEILQGAPATYSVPVSDPDGSRPDLTGATADWFVRTPPPSRVPSASQFMPTTNVHVHKAGLPVTPDGAGGFRVILSIDPTTDLAGVPTDARYQHEVWVTPQGGPPGPVTFGPLDFRSTAHGD